MGPKCRSPLLLFLLSCPKYSLANTLRWIGDSEGHEEKWEGGKKGGRGVRERGLVLERTKPDLWTLTGQKIQGQRQQKQGRGFKQKRLGGSKGGGDGYADSAQGAAVAVADAALASTVDAAWHYWIQLTPSKWQFKFTQIDASLGQGCAEGDGRGRRKKKRG